MVSVLLKTGIVLIVGVLLMQCTSVDIRDSENVELDIDGPRVVTDVTIALDPSSFGDLFGSHPTAISNPSDRQLDELSNYLDSYPLQDSDIDTLKEKLKECRSELRNVRLSLRLSKESAS